MTAHENKTTTMLLRDQWELLGIYCKRCLILFQAWHCVLRACFISDSEAYQSYLINCVFESHNLSYKCHSRNDKDFISNAYSALFSFSHSKRAMIYQLEIYSSNRDSSKRIMKGWLWCVTLPLEFALFLCLPQLHIKSYREKKFMLWKGHNQRWNLLFDIFLLKEKGQKNYFRSIMCQNRRFHISNTHSQLFALWGRTKGQKFNILCVWNNPFFSSFCRFFFSADDKNEIVWLLHFNLIMDELVNSGELMRRVDWS